MSGTVPEIDAIEKSQLRDRPDFRVGDTINVHFRIREDRIFRNGELRYFDHPKFGLLARVVRIEDDEESPEQGELLGYPLQ